MLRIIQDILLPNLVPFCPAVSEKKICTMVGDNGCEVMRMLYFALWSMLGKR
jgi:hypothetical protein